MAAETQGPLIVTAQLGAADQAWADGLRRAHYPPERNQVPAHITLFHQLPPSLTDELRGLLAGMSTQARPLAMIGPIRAADTHVAMEIRSRKLADLRAELAERFARHLIPQDQAEPRFHITIQNKVLPAQAKETAERLRAEITPRPIIIAALAVWAYRGGPWEPISRYAFRG